ncbi:MAG: Asp-tRNA(Asn)/Glu-tRNA(Gln) amidotransferase GatCAB subunit B [Gammaproteobacteria bacterium]|nr:Asp-tRNA(Asn)/Glu-tRNA(Gln) amidotransferase GatCAB subunit B [Gammaproteobacteria bacterium]|tara:strand:+ start:576 stop:2006 length:1431 start_codon:yes stop_codon:yes gene_type:complete
MSNWETVIGLEIHVQLLTKSKIFSTASTKYGELPNAQASYVDLGLPGTLPVLNEEVIKKAVQFGIAINGKVSEYSIFARKSYFYPDLPKNYQISQYELPIIEGGNINIIDKTGKEKLIKITRAHLEEDAGKSIHNNDKNKTYLDLNRAGTPLLEIVSEPEISNSHEAIQYMKKIHEIVTSLKISDGNMQEGSFRCDANVSIKKSGDNKLGTRTELKNINSFKFVEKAIDYEINRQINLLEDNEKIIQETRLYDEKTNTTKSMRSKEEANDYRYFPDPDLQPIFIDEKYIENIKKEMSELPGDRRERYIGYMLNDDQINILMNDPAIADFIDKVLEKTKIKAVSIVNYFITHIYPRINKDNVSISNYKVKYSDFINVVEFAEKKKIKKNIIKQIFDDYLSGSKPMEQIINSFVPNNKDNSELEKTVKEVLSDNPNLIKQYKEGKTKVLGFFVGQVLKKSKGSLDPEDITECIKSLLD